MCVCMIYMIVVHVITCMLCEMFLGLCYRRWGAIYTYIYCYYCFLIQTHSHCSWRQVSATSTWPCWLLLDWKDVCCMCVQWCVSMFTCCLWSPEGRPGDFWCLHPVLNLKAASLIPLFYISSLALLPSPVTISVWSFSAFGPFSWSVFPKPHFSEK